MHHPNRSCLLLSSLLLSTTLFAQQRPTRPTKEGEVETQEITIEKSRKIELPPANRIFNRIPSVKPSAEQRKMTYEFEDRKLTVGDPRITPGVLAPSATQAEENPAYTNYVKLGAGNYSSFLGEGFVGIDNGSNLSLEASAQHLSSAIGPVDGRNSGQSDTRARVTGKYLTDAFKLQADLGFDRNAYGFYGYSRAFAGNEGVSRDAIRQRLNIVNFKVGIENVNAENAIDYSLQTGITNLRDLYNAGELDWGTNFNASLGISDNFFALVAADAYVTQRTDGPIVDNRNLFRVKPTFKYTSSLFTITAGINAVNQTDQRQNINNTRAFPVVDIDVVPAGNIHFFAGLDGDINRNTLRSFLGENKWLAPQVLLVNTVKSLDIYGGSKGALGGGFSYEGKVSFARYRNFSTFNNTLPDTSKFFVLYDGGLAQLLTVSGQLSYAQKDKFRSTLKGDFFRYGLDRLEEAWGRPRFAGSWTNSYTLNKKLFITADLYFLEGIKNKNLVTNTVYTLKPIYDLNVKIDYFLGKQVAAFVSLNNIIGQNYQRYLYYPTQGLNFLGGISYSF
ncbi:TonB-dependent receptor [Spirosoma sp. KUDC1026]|uniref:TonB-dependent receptor n=1 Tax=Spirosoma sp. KUDC1026 TaxID=2745947 RepID=UPI00159BE870|nr:TonB-dependent receptor [Spirosoma sp. KUDC1026]QKZ13933.1 TonB-dependent receptor [Spirosoma sp. KUDC1026]